MFHFFCCKQKQSNPGAFDAGNQLFGFETLLEVICKTRRLFEIENENCHV